MSDVTINLTATGNVRPYRFVKETGRYLGAQASSATDVCCGISGPFLRGPNVNGKWQVVEDFVAVAGEPIPLKGAGEVCLLEAGGAIPAGSRVRSDANGKGVVASATENAYAIAWENAAADGDLIKVLVWPDSV
jgi:hypothetical protein